MRRIRGIFLSAFTLTASFFNKSLMFLVRETKDPNPQKVKRGLLVFLKAAFKKFLELISYINNLKHRNILIGSTILLALFLISWNTELMPESNEPLIFDDEGNFVAAPPAPPSLIFPLGTDLGARSMVNLVLVGVKYTLGAILGITLARLLVGTILALITKLLYPCFKRYFSAFFWPFRYIPQLLVAIILMLPVASIPTGISAMVILEYQLIIMLLVGLPGVYYYILDMIEEIEKQPYVLSSILMGASKFHTLKKHIWPNIKSHLLLLTTQQILSILQLLTFLGIFSLYLGGPHPTPLTDTPRLIYRTITNELAGMAGQNFWLIRRAPWMAYSPILIIAFIAIIVNWMKKGVEDHIAGVVPVKQMAITSAAKEDTSLSRNFVIVGVQEQPETEYEKKIYISDLIREILRDFRGYLSRYKVYRIIEKSALRVAEYISEYPKPIFTTLLTVSFVLWAGVFSYAEFFGNEEAKKKETSVGASTEPKEDKDLFSYIFTNKEHAPVKYKADLTYQDAEATLQGTLHVSTTNTTGSAQDKIYFHLYPNQFKEPIDGPDWEFVRGPSPTPGWIDIENIKVNNQEADFKVEGTILEIQMGEWKDKATAELDLQFNFQLPENYSNTSYDYAAVWLGNFLPKQAVYDKNGWNLDPYSPIGHPFYSETANYDVTINAADKFEILSNAEEVNATTVNEGESRKYTAKVDNVRDFSVVLLDKQYYQTERFMTRNETLVNVWYRPSTDKQETANRNAMAAGQSIDYFEEFYGSTLPYKELDIIRTAEGNPQTAYQGMIFSPGYNFSENNFGSLSMADGVIRQWLSGMVGSQGYKEPWVNESLVSYSLKTYMGEKGYTISQTAEEQLKQQDEIARIQKEGQYLSSPLSDFKNINDYTVLMGIHGYNMYAELDYIVKAGKVNKALKTYINDFANKNASGHDVIELFEKAGHPQAKGYFEGWLKPELKE
ncbi:ABC transporter permease subunit [Mesobacillus selenatarsenatis]|uniref:Aminopeptidase N n=1 Tax=Mesobacillus selenatarsenatis (strain DSM 18680 / JCM 14380 / FERM P-15431 / SF-1) TaxID=1321606 RepID=A0A0A8X1J2_MESS1|nr:ABC transporter permease subunit [Mesobacillus selenatarsenatis]GAM13134.1 aminopeptidase N [Mesobacillus selenatarsenatis SF-1]